MPTIRHMYGLFNKKTGELVKYYYENNEGKGHCVPYSYYLDDTHYRGDEYWLVDSRDIALMAKWTSESWFNAHYETPVNPFHPKDLEVVGYVEELVFGEDSIMDEVKKVNKILSKQGYGDLSERVVQQVLENDDEIIGG